MSFRQVFRHRNFAWLCLMRLLSHLSLLTQSVAIGWQVYTISRLTHGIEESSFLVGMIGLAQFVPFFIFSLIAGESVDRYDRRKILLIGVSGEIACNGALAWLALFPHPSLILLFAIAAAHNTIRAFLGPATAAMMPMLVPHDVRPQAVAWSSLSMQCGRIAGPWIGGALCAVSLFSAYMAATCGFIMAWFCVLLIKAKTTPQHKPGSRLALIGEGLSYLWSNSLVFGAISLDLLAVLLGGATALLPVYARDILQVGPQGFGLLRSAPAVGGLVTLGVLAFKPIARHAGKWMFGSVAVFGLTTIIFAVSEQFWLSMIMLVFLGVADSVSVFIRQTLVQIVTPDQFRGRISAVSSLFISASNDLGEFESGVAARLMGPIGSVVFGGIGSLIVTGLWAKLFPALRKADNLESPSL
jgi:MFS family permease